MNVNPVIKQNMHKAIMIDAIAIQNATDMKSKIGYSHHAAGVIDAMTSIGVYTQEESIYWYNILGEVGACYG